ncbi:MAG TPA: hypothetical protein VF994_17565 [Myxococcales bacterium]
MTRSTDSSKERMSVWSSLSSFSSSPEAGRERKSARCASRLRRVSSTSALSPGRSAQDRQAGDELLQAADLAADVAHRGQPGRGVARDRGGQPAHLAGGALRDHRGDDERGSDGDERECQDDGVAPHGATSVTPRAARALRGTA